MTDDLAGQTAIVTGAAGGVGKAIARKLGEHGAGIVIVDTNTEGGEAVESELRDDGIDAMFIACDIASVAETEAMAETVVDEFGRIDILVNNAAIFSEGHITEVETEYWEKYMDVNLRGQYNCVSAVVDQMTDQQRGNIVNIASMAGRNVGASHASDYTISQWGLIGMTKHLAWELGNDGIRVNVLCPGLVLTEINQERISQDLLDEWLRHTALTEFPYPEDIADGVYYLTSDLSSKVTGTVLEIDSGEQLNKRPIIESDEVDVS